MAEIETDKGSRHNDQAVKAGIVLVPRPSDSPHDPLNWPHCRKVPDSGCALSGFILWRHCPPLRPAQPRPAGQDLWQDQGSRVVCSLAGMAFGPFFVAPVAHRLGRSSVIFWCILCTLICQIWAAVMTHSDDYIAYVMSRLFAGFFGAVPTVIGPRVITDLLFLHQRGRAFTALHMSFLFGTIAGPTFSAFISAGTFFPVEFWWSVGLLGATAILILLFLEETAFDRTNPESNIIPPSTWLANRRATFFFGQSIIRPTSWSTTARIAIVPVLIGLCPVTLIMGTFTLISFGFYVGMNALVPVWLQRSPSEGGYGFSLRQNAAFTFCHWIGLILVQLAGHQYNDRLPLLLARRLSHGAWKPEYRLHVLWIPSLILNPIGLGLFGATLQYHLHYMVLALAVFIVTVGSLASVPVTVNYVVECFTRYPAEAGIVVGAYRIVYGLTISFYIDPWVEAVDVGWVYGMMAFFAVFSFLFVGLLMWKGDVIRGWQVASVASSEEGVQVEGEAGECGKESA